MIDSTVAILSKTFSLFYQFTKILFGIIFKTLKRFWKVLVALALLIGTVLIFKKTKGEQER